MRLALAILGAAALVNCASSNEAQLSTGSSGNARVIIGLAEASDATQPYFDMLWRRIDPDTGRFEDLGNGRSIEIETNSDSSVRVSGIPGEFEIVEVEPGIFGLDSVFARERDGRITYVAQGLIEGPQRPGFEIRAGESVYLGIWEARIDGAFAVARLWRLEESDLRALARSSDSLEGRIAIRETVTASATCEPRRLSNLSTRQIC